MSRRRRRRCLHCGASARCSPGVSPARCAGLLIAALSGAGVTRAVLRSPKVKHEENGNTYSANL